MTLKRWYLNLAQSRSKLMAVRGLAIQEPMPPTFIDRPTTGDFLLMHFHTAAKVRAGQDLISVAPHTLFIWPPGQPHYFGNDAQPWLHSWIHCDGSLVHAVFEACAVALQRPLQLRDAQLTEKYLRLIYDEMSSFVEQDALVLEGILSLWMRELVRATHPAPRANRIPQRLIAVRQYIDSDPTRPLCLVHLAKKAALSVTQFSIEFRRFFGTSPMNYVMRVRMHKALHHLSNPGLCIKEIALMCGFSDAFHFSRQFRKNFGKSPREHRNAARQSNDAELDAKRRHSEIE